MIAKRRVFRRITVSLLIMLAVLVVGPLLIPIPPLENTLPPEALAWPDSRFIEVNGLTVHYQQTGQGEPAVILLHGFGASTYSWREVMEPLGGLGTVVAFDRPAFGLTERPLPGEWTGESPYAPSAQVDLLFGLMDALQIDRAVLIGNSAGGTVAMNAALANPQRVQALVLVDAAVYNGGGSPAFLRLLFQTPQMDRLGVLLARSISTRGMDILYAAWHDQSKITPEIIENYRKPLLADHWDAALWELTRASRASDLEKRLGGLDLPVLVVTGDDDRIVPTADSIRLAGEIRNAQLAVFERCGHVPQEECPEAFLRAVIPFIRGLGE